MKVTIYLGSKCNLNCAYCHKDITNDVSVSQEFIDRLKTMDDLVVKFMGGEPLLYMDAIKKFVDELPNAKFIITTNGVLLGDHIEYFRKHKVYICLSYDGAGDNVRGFDPFTKVLNYPWLQVSCVLYHGNTDLKKIYDDFAEKEDIIGRPISFCPHIMHVTNDTNKKYALTKEDYDSIIEQYKAMLEEFYNHVALMGVPLRKYHGLYSFFMRGMKAGYEYGETYCVNKNAMKVDVAGNEYSCHYIRDYNARNGLNPILDEFPCKDCDVYSMCGGACVKSKEHHLECYFYKTMYRWFRKWYEDRKEVLSLVGETRPYDNSEKSRLKAVYGFSTMRFSNEIKSLVARVVGDTLDVEYMHKGNKFNATLDLKKVGKTSIIVRKQSDGEPCVIYDYHTRLEEMGLLPGQYCERNKVASVVQVYSLSDDRFYLKCIGSNDMKVYADGKEQSILMATFQDLDWIDGRHSFVVFPHEVEIKDEVITTLWRVMISHDYPKKLYITYNGQSKRVREGLMKVSFPYKDGAKFYWGDEGTKYEGRTFSIEQEV